MNDQEIIYFILKGLKESNKISFRDNDLLQTFVAGKDLVSDNIHLARNLREHIQTDYQNFKKRLIDYISRNKIPFIQGQDDFFDIFSNKETYNDYVKVYTLQSEIDRLDVIASDSRSQEKERIDAFERMYQLYNQERNILEKYGE